MKPWKQLSTEVKFKNPWWEYRLDTYELPNGKQGEYHYLHTGGAALVIPVLADGSLMLVEQYRYLMRRMSIEFAGGSCHEGETPEVAAVRECREELGVKPMTLDHVGELSYMNGVSDEMVQIYLARQTEHAPLDGDEGEDTTRRVLTIEQIDAAIQNGDMWDAQMIATWHLIRPRLVD